MQKQNYYQLLNISPDADAQEIKRAYRRLALKYHPDTHPDDPIAVEKFKAVSEAYRTLIKPDSRAEYDHRLQQFQPSNDNNPNIPRDMGWQYPEKHVHWRDHARELDTERYPDETPRVPFRALFISFAFVACSMVFWVMFIIEGMPDNNIPTNEENTATSVQETLDAIHEDVPEYRLTPSPETQINE